MSGAITSIEMSTNEENRLVELEQVVEEGIETVFAVGKALAEIRDSKLYRQTHNTFSAYLNSRWQISESRGYQLMAASKVSTIVEAAGLPAPTNEGQARELSGLDDPQVREAWQKATEASYGKPTTAKAVRDARNQVAPPPPTKPRRRPLPDQFISAVLEMQKSATRLGRLSADNRLAPNRETIAPLTISDIDRAITTLLEVRAKITGTKLFDDDLSRNHVVQIIERLVVES